MSLRRFSDYFAILASGVSLLTVVLVYQANLMQFIQQYLQFIQQYSDAVITIAAVLIYAVILSVGIYFGRRRKLNRNRLKGLGKDISTFRWFMTQQRMKQFSSSPEFDEHKFREKFDSDWKSIRDVLEELGIPFPKDKELRQVSVFTYLDMLFPLALNGDVDEARIFLRRVQGESVDSFLAGLMFWN